MTVLLCWSKERSRMLASALHEWLPKVVVGIKPWMSELDLEKGRDWFHGLESTFSEAKAVIVCVTPENVRSPWLYYETGQVGGRLPKSPICPYLLDNQPSILSDGPLGRLQCTVAKKEDTFRLVQTLNRTLPIASDDTAIGSAFENEWNSLNGSLKRILAIDVEAPSRLESTTESSVDRLAGEPLSSEERKMLLEMGRDKHGVILITSTSSGFHFVTNGIDLNEGGDARSTARWRAAHHHLVRLRAIEMRGSKGEVFALTAKGFELVDLLNAATDNPLP